MTADTDGGRYLVFETEHRRYACTLSAVREIVAFQGATRLPGAPAYIVGLINLRGRLITVVDLAVQLGARSEAQEDDILRRRRGSIVLLEAGSKALGVLVDDVRDVRPVEAGAVELIDGTGSEADGARVMRGIARLEDGDVIVLDTQVLVGSVLQ